MSDYWTGLLNHNPMKTYNFSNFKDAVDKQIQSKLGCSINDLADYPYSDDWCECEEELAFVAPEDTERKERVFNNHVLYTIEEVVNECYNDAHPYTRGVDY